MTIIAIKGNICAWDSQISYGPASSSTTNTKVVPIASMKGLYAGGCGVMGEIQKWQRWLNRMDSESLSEWFLEPEYKAMSANTLLFAWHSETGYIVEVYKRPTPPAHYKVPKDGLAIGTGDDYAMGAMAMGASPIKAVELVCKKYDGCGPPVNSNKRKKAAANCEWPLPKEGKCGLPVEKEPWCEWHNRIGHNNE